MRDVRAAPVPIRTYREPPPAPPGKATILASPSPMREGASPRASLRLSSVSQTPQPPPRFTRPGPRAPPKAPPAPPTVTPVVPPAQPPPTIAPPPAPVPVSPPTASTSPINRPSRTPSVRAGTTLPTTPGVNGNVHNIPVTDTGNGSKILFYGMFSIVPFHSAPRLNLCD